jgi:hypothetical protein
MVMKTAENRLRCDDAETLNRARERGVFGSSSDEFATRCNIGRGILAPGGPALISPRIFRDREETFPLRGLNPRASKPRPRGLTEIRGPYHFDWTNSTSSKELGHRT